MNQSLQNIHAISRITVAVVWFYHGLVPKVLGPHSDEILLAQFHGIPDDFVFGLLRTAGVLEMLFGVAILIFWRYRWPLVLSMLGLFALLIDIAVVEPAYLFAAFNPTTLNISVIALSVIAYMTCQSTPTMNR